MANSASPFVAIKFRSLTPAVAAPTGYYLHSFVAGTSTPQATYTDSTAAVANVNPLPLDAYGQAQVWLKAGSVYKLQVRAGSSISDTLIEEVDYVTGDNYVSLVASLTADLADASTATKGADLVGYKGRTVRDRLEDVFSSRDYSTLQAALTAMTNGGTLMVFGSHTLTNKITVDHANISIVGMEGATITWSALGTGANNSYGATTVGIQVNANNFSISNVKLVGPHTASYVGQACLIQAQGTSKTVKLNGLTISNCEITNVGAYGLYCQYVDYIEFNDNYIHDVGYAGINCDSCSYGSVKHNRIETITPGTSGNMYGLSIGMYSPTGWEDTSGTYDPMSSDWLFADNIIKDVAWEGIDAHGSKNVIVERNKVYNVKQGIGISTNSNGTVNDRYGGYNVIVRDNLIDARDADASVSGRENLQYGINVNGGGARLAVNIKVLNNVVLYKGVVSETNPEAGAIQCAYCYGLEVSGNVIDYWGGNAIAWNESEFVTFANNRIGQLANSADTQGYGFICSTANSSPVLVTGNACYAEGGTAAKRAWRQENNTRRPMMVGNDFTDAGIPISLGTVGFVAGNQAYQLFSVTSDTSPSISGALPGVPVVIEVNNGAGGLTITDIDDGLRGQIAVIKNIGTSACVFTRNNARLLSGSNWTGATYQSLTLIKADTGEWHELGRSGSIS